MSGEKLHKTVSDNELSQVDGQYVMPGFGEEDRTPPRIIQRKVPKKPIIPADHDTRPLPPAPVPGGGRQNPRNRR